MPLFDVPGWSVPGAPAPETHGSRKRKRPSSDGGDNKLETAHINFEKLMEKLEASNAAPVGGKKQKKERERRKNDGRDSAQPTSSEISAAKSKGKKRKQEKAAGKQAKTPMRDGNVERAESNAESGQMRTPKMKRDTHQRSHPSTPTHEGDVAGSSKLSSQQQKLTKLQAGLKSSLDGARFRCEPCQIILVSYSSCPQLDQ